MNFAFRSFVTLLAGVMTIGLMPMSGSALGAHTAYAQGCSYVGNKTDFSEPNMARPGYLKPYTDPDFGTKITRVSGDRGTPIANVSGAVWPGVTKHHYGSTQAWNSDMSMLWLIEPWLFLDGHDYHVLFQRNPPANSAIRWDNGNAERMVFTTKNQIGFWYPRTNQSNIAHTFSEYDSVDWGGRNKGNLTNDGKRIALIGIRGGTKELFMYDISTNKKYPAIDFGNKGYGYDIDGQAFKVSPRGDYILQVGKGGATGRAWNAITGADMGWEGNGLKHQDVTIDTAGDEVAVAVNNTAVYSGIPSGSLVKVRLSDGKRTLLNSGSVANHTSAQNYRQGEWMVGSYDSSRQPFQSEIVAAALDGSGRIRRLAHTHADLVDYDAETHPSLSPDGSKLVFASSWDNSNGGEVSTFVIDLCGGGNGLGAGSAPVIGPCNAFGSGVPAQTGYGVPWNVFSSAKELLLTSTCKTSSVDLQVGTGNQNHAIYKQGYRYTTTWSPFTLSGTAWPSTTEWLSGKGTYTLNNPPSGTTWWVGYTCNWSGTAWQCGCADSSCSQNYWQLQGIKR